MTTGAWRPSTWARTRPGSWWPTATGGGTDRSTPSSGTCTSPGWARASNASRRLHPDAIERTLAVLRKYRDIMDSTGVEGVRATATSAARDAANRDDLLVPAAEILGTTVEMLTGEEEGRLTFLGATTGLDAPAPHLVVDIGGGPPSSSSAPESPGRGAPDVAAPVGRRRLRPAHRGLAPLRPARARGAVPGHLGGAGLPRRRRPRSPRRRAGPDAHRHGRARSPPSPPSRSGLPEYDPEVLHHFRLTQAAAEDVFRTLATEPAADRRHNPGLEPARVDVIVGGAAVLVSVMRHWGFEEMIVSEADILDGLIRSQL